MQSLHCHLPACQLGQSWTNHQLCCTLEQNVIYMSSKDSRAMAAMPQQPVGTVCMLANLQA